MPDAATFSVFLDSRRIAHGDLLAAARAAVAAHPQSALVFDDASGNRVEFDVRLGVEGALAAYRDQHAPTRQGRGRPRLGVTPREVTLLPRHWDWLARRRGGASAALRRLVEDAIRADDPADRLRLARETVYRVMSVLAGDLPDFEAASRALFAGRQAEFSACIAAWPADIRGYLVELMSRRALNPFAPTESSASEEISLG